MRIQVICFLFVFGRLVTGQNADDGVRVAGTNDKCAEFCTKKFQDASLKSCQQGCRLYSVLQFVDNANGNDRPASEPNSTAFSSSCEKECNEAYKDVVLKGACANGCQHQTPFTTGNLRIVMDSSSPMFPFANKLMTDAFGKFDDIQNRMLERMEKVKNWFKDDPFGTSTLTNFGGPFQDKGLSNVFDRMDSHFRNLFNRLTGNGDFGADTIQGHRLAGGKDVASVPDPAVVNPLYAYANGLLKEHDNMVKDLGRTTSNGDLAPTSSLDDSDEPILVIKVISDGLSDGDEERDVDAAMTKIGSPTMCGDDRLTFNGDMDVDADDTWLASFARRTQNLPSITRWLLCIALMLSILCIIYLCLAILRASQQRRRLNWQQKMGNLDGGFVMLPPTYEKLAPLPSYSVKDEEKQRESPPPAYEIAVGPATAVQTGDVKES